MTRTRWILIGCVAALLVALGVGAAGGRGILYQAIYNSGDPGAADRSAQSKLQDSLSIKDFGAKGDGIVNDSTALTNAIAAASGTQIINLPCPGTYKTTAYGTLSCGDYYPPLAGVTGSYPRSVPQKILDILDIKDFGAKGDGVTDDEPALQAAINYATSIGGATIYFPPATYYVGSTASVGATGDRITLLGSRGNSSITTLSGTYAHLDLHGTSGDFIQHFTISNMRFIGSGLGVQTRFTESLYVERSFFSGTQNGLYMSMVGGEQDVKATIIGNRFDNVQNGIQSGDTRVADINIAFNYFVDNTTRALNLGYIDGGAIVYNKIFNSLSSATENDGIQILRPVYVKLEGNDVFQVNGYGIRLSSPRRTHVVGNTVIATGLTNKKTAFVVLQYPAITPELNEIRDNKIYQPYGSGMDLAVLTNSDVTGNKIVGAGQGGAVYDAITCTSCVGVRLLDNFIDGQSVTRYWLSLTTSTSINLGMGNTYTATVQADLFRSGTNTMSIGRNPTATSQTAAYAATYLDSVINADATGGTFAITLPSAAAAPGKVYEIVKTDSTTNAVTIATTGGQTVNGLATASGLTTQYAKATLTSDGTNWQAVFAGTETLLFSRHIAGLIAASTTYTRTQLPTNGTFVLDAVTSNINGGPAAAGAGTIVFRITDGTNNCDCTANCITTSPHFGSLSSAPRVPCTGTCSFAGGTSLAFTTTTANCATTLPTVVSIDARGHWK